MDELLYPRIGVKHMSTCNKIKPSFDTERQVLGKIYPLSTPFTVILDASEACNFKCNYCFRADFNKAHWGYAKDNQVMSWELFIKAVEQIKSFPQTVKQISLSNHGEPLVNRKLPDMVRYIKNVGIRSKVAIHTNASLLNEKYAYDLADSNIDRIVISLQGLDEEKYYETCGVRIDYERFYSNLCLLYNAKKDTQIHIKIANTALREKEENKFYEMYQSISDRVFIEQIVPIWKDVKINDASDIKNKYGKVFEKQQCCPLIFNTIVITPIGDVYPCTQLLSPYKLGNVNDVNVVELWNGSLRRELLFKQCKMNNPDLCKSCYILQNCICTEEDMIDSYREEILERLERGIYGDSR